MWLLTPSRLDMKNMIDYQYAEQGDTMAGQQQGFANVQNHEDLRQYIDKDTGTKESVHL